jgi:predicted YcjX-like family ATPase
MASPGLKDLDMRGALDWLGARAVALRRSADAMLGRNHVRIGVTGLSGAGKSVFTTSLVHALTHASDHPAAMPLFAGMLGTPGWTVRIEPLEQLAPFPQAANIAGLLADPPLWPAPTRSLLGLAVRLVHRADPARELRIDIVDYPGEWLLDLELLRLDYATWSAATLARLQARGNPAAEAAGVWLGQALGAAQDATSAERIVGAYGSLLVALREQGLRHLQPGRLLVPDPAARDLAPAPLPVALDGTPLHRAMATRYDGYRERIVRPFYTEHFARLDRQIVLFDAIGALARGPAVFADTQSALTSVLTSFRYHRLPWLDWLRARIDRVLVVATKVDHVTASQYLNLRQLIADRFETGDWAAAIAGERIRFDVVASIRATRDGWIRHDGAQRAAVQGVLKGEGGTLRLLVPSDVPAKAPEPGAWPEGGFVYVDFAPPDLRPFADRPFPNVNLDKALDYLVGDRLR